MKLVSIAEDQVTVTLRWHDLALLGHICRAVAESALFGNVGEEAINAYAGALGALCEGAGMASRAPSLVREWCADGDYTLEHYRRGTAADAGLPHEEAPPAA